MIYKKTGSLQLNRINYLQFSRLVSILNHYTIQRLDDIISNSKRGNSLTYIHTYIYIFSNSASRNPTVPTCQTLEASPGTETKATTPSFALSGQESQIRLKRSIVSSIPLQNLNRQWNQRQNVCAYLEQWIEGQQGAKEVQTTKHQASQQETTVASIQFSTSNHH